jgi:uncharacterized RDD family membrane protein YckC
MSNPYAPPRAAVHDIADPNAGVVAANRGRRLAAAMLDSLIFFTMVYAPLVVGGMLGGSGRILALTGLVVWCWLTIRSVRRSGQSIGKRLLRIKVVRRSGAPITLGRLFWLRNFVNGMISFIPLYGFVDLLFIFGESRQCLHDRIADTIVVNA